MFTVSVVAVTSFVAASVGLRVVRCRVSWSPRRSLLRRQSLPRRSLPRRCVVDAVIL